MIDKYLNKNFIWGGYGNGYDCVTLSKSILEEVFNITISKDYLAKNPEKALITNPMFLRNQLSTLFTEIEFNGKELRDILKPYDILLFRFHKIDCHLGVYLSDLEFISILEQQTSDKFTLVDRWLKRLNGVFRYEDR